MEAVVVEQDARTAIDVREGILRLAVFFQHVRRYLTVPLYELEDGIFGDFRTGGGELHEGFEAWIRFSQNGVSVARDYLAGFQGRPEVAFDGSVGEGCADVGLHFQDPAEDFLGCESEREVLESV